MPQLAKYPLLELEEFDILEEQAVLYQDLFGCLLVVDALSWWALVLVLGLDVGFEVLFAIDLI